MKAFLKILAGVFLAFTCGCGVYHMGSIMHPQIKSIAVAPVKNNTLEPYVSAELRNMLCEQYMVDGSLKLKTLGTADCIIYSRVTEITTIATQEDSVKGDDNYVPAEWEVTIKATFTVLLPGKKKPLIPEREVSGSALYQVIDDIAITRTRGIKMACYRLAEKMVQYTTEAW